MVIKCPECGRQVSDRAPQCPNCGVEIAGKIVRCANCGEVYFLADRLCPQCHQINGRYSAPQPVQQTQQPQQKSVQDTTTPPQSGEQFPEGQPKKRNYTALIISFVFAAIICGGMFYFYFNSQSANEEKEYELAMKSDDQMVLEAYLDKFNGVNEVHYADVKKRLEELKGEEAEWMNTVTAGSRQQFELYCKQHPNSIHCQEAMNKIDSIDWTVAMTANSQEAFKTYLAQHPDGTHASEAQIQMDQLTQQALSDTEVKPEEQAKVVNIMRKFFQALNSNSEASLRSTLASTLSFNGKSGATPDDAVAYMNNMYKNKEKHKVRNFNWTLDRESFNIQKQPQPVDVTMAQAPQFAYQMTYTVIKNVTTADGSETQGNYTVTATVSPDGKISSIRISGN